MKKFPFFILLIVFFSNNSFCQSPTTIVCSDVSYRENMLGDGWSEWNSPKPIDIICLIDFDKNKFTITSSAVATRDIVKYYNEEVLPDGERRSTFDTKLNDGSISKVILHKLPNNKGTRLYLMEQTINFCYTVKKVE